MKYALLKITPQILIEILKSFNNGFNGHFEVIKGLPEDTEFVDMHTDSTIGYAMNHPSIVNIKVRSDEFEDIPKGQKLPILEPPILKRHYDK